MTAACHAVASAIAGVRTSRWSASVRAEASDVVMPRRWVRDLAVVVETPLQPPASHLEPGGLCTGDAYEPDA